ncbi:probable sugar phosphate/phosphate translocator at3g11320 [Phtheirospermum japonicum]|uniref:Probable sugar phosphate/phosphate translocator at3g11320 n=1 Tax=Phtheirospermum japonicum TaxID=374723 RepID=A0A830CSE1_9LAMI|nr:probable sugar phosphate/phosphate translocator at3g11320 [Phtheirospermum japonicum]
MTACSLLSYIAIAWMKIVPMQTIRSRVQFMKITTLSLIFCASVVSGNISLKYLPVSFNQAIGATIPFFTFVFAYMMTLKREAWLTCVTLLPVVTGVVIASGVSSIKVICNKNTGIPEGYGFVEFFNHTAAEKVLQSYIGITMTRIEQYSKSQEKT